MAENEQNRVCIYQQHEKLFSLENHSLTPDLEMRVFHLKYFGLRSLFQVGKGRTRTQDGPRRESNSSFHQNDDTHTHT